MPVRPTYPGVYVEELKGDVRTIVGVSTSVTAFVGECRRGPVNRAVRVLGYGDFERRFGGLDADSETGHAVRQFFLNGGSEAWVVRVAKGAVQAELPLNGEAGAEVLKVRALDAGPEGNRIVVRVAHSSANPASNFDLRISYASPSQPHDAVEESFPNLSMNSGDARYVGDRVNGVSSLVEIERLPAALDDLGAGKSVGGKLEDGSATADVDHLIDEAHHQLRVVVNGLPPVTVVLPVDGFGGGSATQKLNKLCEEIEASVQGQAAGEAALANFTCAREGKKVVMTSGAPGEHSSVRVLPGERQDAAARLRLGAMNGGVDADAVAVHRPAVVDGDGKPLVDGDALPIAAGDAYAAIVGSREQREGLFALEDVDLFNILCLPGITNTEVLTDAEVYCRERRAFLIVDPPATYGATSSPPTPAQMEKLVRGPHGPADPRPPRSDHAALFYPWLRIADPLKGGKLRAVPPSGTVAGLFARTDAKRGVWKAPAGTEASLIGVRDVTRSLTDVENGVLNPRGVNCLRVFPVHGAVAWGSRTLRGDDDLADEYKYVPVRRLALYIEESLYRGTQWVVFEPNDEPLWAQIRLNVGSFMHDLFRQGAFQGTTPREAYLVKCDRETTTQSDVDRGVVNVLVGFAPLKPAEFVILKIQQLAGQLQS